MPGVYKMDFMKGIVRLVKVNEMYKILKSPLANRFRSRDGIGWTKFLLEFAIFVL